MRTIIRYGNPINADIAVRAPGPVCTVVLINQCHAHIVELMSTSAKPMTELLIVAHIVEAYDASNLSVALPPIRTIRA
ncbi:MAG: hypothetical protein ACKPKO_62930, partial [Candidatus Fonsibacter sp.]